MAYFTESARLVRNLWTAPISRLPHSDTLVPRVPEGLNDLARWATVVTSSSGDRTRGHDLVCVASDSPSLCVFRVHGYIKECDFRPFGNWNSENAGAASAKQTLTLSPGRDVQAFNAQVAGLRTVVALIERVLVAQAADTRTPQTSNGLTRELRLQRRVFTRVRNGEEVPSALDPADDPFGHVRGELGDEWVTATKLATLAQAEDLKAERCHPSVFARGDFVEVLVTADIAHYTNREARGKKFAHRTIRVYWNMEGVLLLCPAAKLFKHPSAVIPESSSGRGVREIDSARLFGAVPADSTAATSSTSGKSANKKGAGMAMLVD